MSNANSDSAFLGLLNKSGFLIPSNQPLGLGWSQDRGSSGVLVLERSFANLTMHKAKDLELLCMDMLFLKL